jgi:hypothetical protein
MPLQRGASLELARATPAPIAPPGAASSGKVTYGAITVTLAIDGFRVHRHFIER